MLKVGMDAARIGGVRRKRRSKQASPERVWRPAAGVDARPTVTGLAGDGIPESGSKIVVRGAIRIACDGVAAVQIVNRQIQ
jgi:hypothetical protein